MKLVRNPRKKRIRGGRWITSTTLRLVGKVTTNGTPAIKSMVWWCHGRYMWGVFDKERRIVW